jgi:hypothetical protein
MSETRFYLSESEQREYLRWVLSLASNRAMVWHPSTDYQYDDLSHSSLEALPFTAAHDRRFRIFMWNKEVSPKLVYRPVTGRGEMIDFAASGLVEFEPSIQVGSIMLSGHLATASRGYYPRSLAGVVAKWYSKLRAALVKYGTREWVLTQLTTSGTYKEWSDVVGSEVVSLWLGKKIRLKQFVNGPVEFDLRRRLESTSPEFEGSGNRFPR